MLAHLRVGALAVAALSYAGAAVAQAPVINTMTQHSGNTGSTVVLIGANFLGTTGVTFGPGLTSALFTVDLPTQITATVPAGATPGAIRVTTPSGTAIAPLPFYPGPVAGPVLGPVFPPPLGHVFSMTGAPGDGNISRAGGKTFLVSGVPLAGERLVAFGPEAAGVRLSFQFANHAGPGEILTYQPSLSNLPNGIAVWTGTTFFAAGSPQVFTRFTMTATDTGTAQPVPLVVATDIGLGPTIGALHAIQPGEAISVNHRFDASDDGVNYIPALALFDAYTGAKTTAYSSYSYGYHYDDKQADLSAFKTDNVTSLTPGGPVTYTIIAANGGPHHAIGATVSDTLPPEIVGATWTCVGASGGTCAASGTGSIGDVVDLPAGGFVTYTLTGTVAPWATGVLSNQAVVFAPALITDTNPANDVFADLDGLSPVADLTISKTDGQTASAPGLPVTYTIVASNAGPSDAIGATVTDTVLPTIVGASWTCSGAGGGLCAASGVGSINDTVFLPAGGSVTYILTGTVDAAATGSLINTATVSAPFGTTDPTPGNNSATDTDILPGGSYFTVSPCRVVDTRGGAPIGGPVMQGQQTRVFAIAGKCGIPASAKAISLNVAMTQSTAGGNARLFPAGQPVPTVASINYSLGQTRANNAVVMLNGLGELAAFLGQAAGTTAHLIIDVNGYFE